MGVMVVRVWPVVVIVRTGAYEAVSRARRGPAVCTFAVGNLCYWTVGEGRCGSPGEGGATAEVLEALLAAGVRIAIAWPILVAVGLGVSEERQYAASDLCHRGAPDVCGQWLVAAVKMSDGLGCGLRVADVQLGVDVAIRRVSRDVGWEQGRGLCCATAVNFEGGRPVPRGRS
jgi:hypothetical protein